MTLWSQVLVEKCYNRILADEVVGDEFDEEAEADSTLAWLGSLEERF